MNSVNMGKVKSLILSDELVSSKIYFIRDQKVMLDIDLAELCQVETGRLNEQVKRNADRFPEDVALGRCYHRPTKKERGRQVSDRDERSGRRVEG